MKKEKGIIIYIYMFKYLYKKIDKKEIKNNDDLKNIYIIKPGEDTNRGYGIKVESNLDNIK